MLDRMTAAEYRAMQNKPSKYKNCRTEYNGRKYPSQLEANRAAELQLMVKAGELCGVMEQVTFHLAGGIKYIADFVLLFPDGTYWVEDAKGVKTKEYQLKKKLMREKGIEILEV